KDPNPPEPVVPAPPRVDSVIRDGTGLVHVVWSQPDSGGSPILNYNVYRRASTGTYGPPLATLPAGTTSFNDNTADPAISFFYKVTAVNALGESTNCGEFPITAPPPINPCIGAGFLVDSDPTGDQLLAPRPAPTARRGRRSDRRRQPARLHNESRYSQHG